MTWIFRFCSARNPRAFVGREIALAFLGVCCLVATGCQDADPASTSSVARVARAAPASAEPAIGPRFSLTDVTAQSGIDFTYRGGAEAGLFTILQGNGGGCGVLDFDGDGKLDLFFAGGGGFGEGPTIQGRASGCFRNLGNGQFREVTLSACLPTPSFYTHGCCGGDFDNDGFIDLAVYGYGGVQLLRNQGDGTWQETVDQAGVTPPFWASGGAWGDMNGDGNLDLFLCNYVDWSFSNNPICESQHSTDRDICGPGKFNGLPDQLYLSQGDGTFRDVSSEWGLMPGGMGMAATIADVDGDLLPDVYVANDRTANFLYLNEGGERLREVGVGSGVALDEEGKANGSMGIEVFDFNGDQLFDLFVSNFERENCALYQSQGSGLFLHMGQRAGISTMGTLNVCWGVAATDLDLDGDQDLVISNGHVFVNSGMSPRRQLPVVLENDREKNVFRTSKFPSQSYCGSPHMGRGLALGDLDGDGDQDLVFSNIDEPVALVRNDSVGQGDWLCVKLIGRASNRDGVGAQLVLHASSGDQIRQVKGGGSYCSQSDLRQHWGLPPGAQATGLTIRWPSGVVQRIEAPEHGRVHYIIEPLPDDGGANPPGEARGNQS
jgi:hypothetical protein